MSIFTLILEKIKEIEKEPQSNNDPDLKAFNKNFKEILTNINIQSNLLYLKSIYP